jgi:hypothetical protein
MRADRSSREVEMVERLVRAEMNESRVRYFRIAGKIQVFELGETRSTVRASPERVPESWR